MVPYYPLGVFRTLERCLPVTHEIICAGFGGQGVMLIGQLIAYAGMVEGKNVSWVPSYGPEMRGGTANCSVVVSDEPWVPRLSPNPTG